MHELSLAESLRELIEERAKTEGFEEVQEVELVVGSLSHVSAEAMSFCFESVMFGTCAERARLKIVTEAGQGRCPSCGALCAMEHIFDPCTACGRFGLDIEAGDQVRLASLLVN